MVPRGPGRANGRIGSRWYFSTMPQRPPGSRVRRVEFHRTKYGRELLFDAAFLSGLPAFDFSDRPQVLTFHDVTLATRGRGVIEIDGVAYRVRPGMLFFTRPGDLRRFRVRGLDGACFFFRAEFVREAFADPRFLDRFRFFGRDRARAAFPLDARRGAGLPRHLRAHGGGDSHPHPRRARGPPRAALRDAGSPRPLLRGASRRSRPRPWAFGRGGALPRPGGTRLRAAARVSRTMRPTSG